ncbi:MULTISPECIES: metallophosphoesterase [unclassified Nodularia (in: cyanobacteria)]|uniref:metallophosphoesterase family protein n=1 Tax=unclassified Nodularia (in: cyanobacteria) TaxID=2656917 RepID=UPI00187F912F|nr:MULTISPECIES: metallophosphoesterase [unclassified Nodularia (in: cyanobacteria)]MBE9200185.1 metallophosphoesterase [Nodularia sp. LEGE 06071]MCC2694745.1 metallophosphoesterase [Nodularia sp. LEGE 04288]
MKLITEPSISEKIHKMKQRVRWHHPQIVSQGIDQTSMVIDDGQEDNPEFSFMVIGDTGTTSHYGYHPQRKVAELMLPHKDQCRFVLHTGDVIYTVGSREYYGKNFIQPYREFLKGGDKPENIPYDRMVFNLPFLPVLGNHDYYDVPLMYRLFTGSTRPLRRFLRYKDIEIGWHGSNQGDAYARAFLDYIVAIASPKELQSHLDQNYTAIIDAGRCLRYQPGHFTRLPNRYYTFRYGGIDFFALDSNTLNTPSPLPETPEGEMNRRELQQRRQKIDQEEVEILATCDQLNPEKPADAEQIDYLKAKLDQINEVKIDIEKQLASNATDIIDFEQLNWLKSRLIESWNTLEVRGRIIFFHHPPYVTEATKWNQAQTLAVRHRLRWVFEQVAETLGSQMKGRSIVDLIFNGHAHCLEHIRTGDTGYADSHINYIISGGSGHYPRRQRREGNELIETFTELPGHPQRKVADSLLFVGRNGKKPQKHLPYSCVKIDVQAGTPPKFIVTPLIADRIGEEWQTPQIQPFVI